MPPRSRVIHVAVADSNQMACRLLSEALNKQAGISVVASVVDGESMMRSAQALQPDIVLISASLQGGPFDRRSRVSEIRSRVPGCPWILLLDQNESQLGVAALRAGAKGIFSRAQSDIGLLAKCIRRVMEGQIWVDNRQTLHLLEALTSTVDGHCGHRLPVGPPKLTPREESVVRLVVQGRPNREIADELHLSEHTIKNYLFRVFDKLGVSNRVELALYAVAKLNLADDTDELEGADTNTAMIPG